MKIAHSATLNGSCKGTCSQSLQDPSQSMFAPFPNMLNLSFLEAKASKGMHQVRIEKSIDRFDSYMKLFKKVQNLS